MNTTEPAPPHPRSLAYAVDYGNPCSACRRLIHAVIFEDFDNEDLWDASNLVRLRELFFKLHYTKLSEVRESARACELCDLIASNLPEFEEHEYEGPNYWIWAQRPRSDDRTGTKSFLVTTMWDDRSREEGIRFELFHKRDPDILDAAEVIETGVEAVYSSDKPSFIRDFFMEMYSRMRTEPYPYSGSDECFTLIAKWMNECLDTHDACPRNRSRFFPTRILDTAPDGFASGLRLCQNENIIEPYLALSHCWGGKVSLRTTTHNLQSHLRGIPMCNVPNTFRDAITVVRKLNYRYLWIDALCILQDSSEDWTAEAAIMDQVYSGAALTISCAESPNSWSGIFAHREQYRSVPLHLSSQRGLRLHDIHVRALLSLGDAHNSYKHLEQSNLNQRAWALQERVLSPAVLHFTKNALIWECRTISRTEDGHVSSCDILFKHLTLHDLSISEDPYTTWYSLVQDYTRRKLTYSSDKTPALDGLAKYFSNEKGVKGYLAGLWEGDLPRGLLWRKEVSLKEIPDRAPSWSWASRDGEISYGIDDLSLPAVTNPEFDLQILKSESQEAVKDGLHILGFLQSTACESDNVGMTPGFNGFLRFWMDERYRGPCWCLYINASMFHDFPRFANVQSSFASSSHWSGRLRARFLVLERVSENTIQTFKRIGTATVTYEEERGAVMTSPERTHLTLI